MGSFDVALCCAKAKSWQIWGCVNSVPKVPALTAAITHPLSGGFPPLCSDSQSKSPGVKRTAAAATFCLWEPRWRSSPSPHRGEDVGFPSAEAEAAGGIVQPYMSLNDFQPPQKTTTWAPPSPCVTWPRKPEEMQLISHIYSCWGGRCILGNATVSQAPEMDRPRAGWP